MDGRGALALGNTTGGSVLLLCLKKWSGSTHGSPEDRKSLDRCFSDFQCL